MNIRDYKWLLFDFDNTLVDFHKSSLLSFKDLLAHIDVPFSEDVYHTYKIENKKVWDKYEQGKIDSITLRSLRFEYFFHQMGIDHDPMDAHEKYIGGLVHHTKSDQQTLDILNTLRDKHQLAIITNGLKEAQRPRLANSTIGNLMDATIVSDEIGFAKPDPQFFNHVINEIKHADKSELLIIGDSLMSDILGGNQSNIDTVWYNPAGNDLHSGVKPTYEIERLDQLL